MFITGCNERGNSPPNSQNRTYVYTQKAPLPKIRRSYGGGAPSASPGSATGWVYGRPDYHGKIFYHHWITTGTGISTYGSPDI